MKRVLFNDESDVLVEDGVDTSSGHYPVIIKNRETGAEYPVKDVQIIFKWGEWEEDKGSEPATPVTKEVVVRFKSIRRGRNYGRTDEVLKGGSGSGNFNHAGRPGQEGGSAPGKGGGSSGATANNKAIETALGNQLFESDMNQNGLVKGSRGGVAVHYTDIDGVQRKVATVSYDGEATFKAYSKRIPVDYRKMLTNIVQDVDNAARAVKLTTQRGKARYIGSSSDMKYEKVQVILD